MNIAKHIDNMDADELRQLLNQVADTLHIGSNSRQGYIIKGNIEDCAADAFCRNRERLEYMAKLMRFAPGFGWDMNCFIEHDGDEMTTDDLCKWLDAQIDAEAEAEAENYDDV